MEKTTCPVRPVLQALGYTPSTLAKDLDISRSKAQRLLNGKTELWLNDVFEISKLLEINPNIITGFWCPGEIRANKAERDRQFATEKVTRERELEEKIAHDRAEFESKTPAEQLAAWANPIIRIIINGFVQDVPGLTADALLTEIKRQLTEQENVA